MPQDTPLISRTYSKLAVLKNQYYTLNFNILGIRGGSYIMDSDINAIYHNVIIIKIFMMSIFALLVIIVFRQK
jgi:hypothetical protein